MRRDVFLTAVTTLVQQIFQFMARALQSPRIGLLYFAAKPGKPGWNRIRSG